MNKQKLYDNLKIRLGRDSSDDEKINAEKDVNLLMELVMERLDIIEKMLNI